MQFDISSISPGEPVILKLYILGAWLNESVIPGFGVGMSIQGYSGSGTVTLDDFHQSNYWNLGGAGALTGSYLPAKEIDLDVTAFVDSLLSSGSDFAGFRLHPSNGTPNGPTRLSLFRPTPDTSAPSLPEPSSLLLGMFGVLGVVGFKLRTGCGRR